MFKNLFKTKTRKITFYIGLNDKDAKEQLITTENAVHAAETYFGDCTVTLCHGYYTHDDGTGTREVTIKVDKLDFSGNFNEIKAASDLKAMFNQESIGFEETRVIASLI